VTRAVIVIATEADRQRAIKWITQAKPGTRVVFKEHKRSIPQNDRLWAMLTDVATQLPWHGRKLTPNDWKFLFLDALKREVRAVPNIDGTGFVNVGRSSSDLSRDEMSTLLELITAFGVAHDVTFHDPEIPT
jgi:hypothetical protein